MLKVARMNGGGEGQGRRRPRQEIEEEDAVSSLFFVPTPAEDDIPLFQDVLRIKDINLDTWASTLDISQLQQLLDIIKKQKEVRTGHVNTIVNPYMQFQKEFNALKVC